MSSDLTEYDIFVSYARTDDDNSGYWIQEYVNALKEEYRIFTGGRQLNVFLDKERISAFSHWKTEIFNKGLVRSRSFLAFLSPAYFASEICRREWRAWIEREIGLHILSEGAAPIYIVEIPAMFGKPTPPEQETARKIAELCQLPQPYDLFVRETEGVIREFRRRQLQDVQPFFRAGLTALRQEDLRRQLARLAQEIDTKSEQLRQAAASERFVPVYNDKFTGRLDELVQLREMLVNDHKGVVAGIHGLGGIGKTELSYTYAHAYAGVYPGGRYLVRCEGCASFVQAFSNLYQDPFHDEISDAERNNEQANFNAVLRAIGRRLRERGSVLLVLDNVTEPELLQPMETDSVTSLGASLHMLATTRLKQAVGIKTLMLKELKHTDALALLEKFCPFASVEEERAAAEIVRRLDGFALAVEVVAARMSVCKLTYAGVLQNLSLDSLDNHGAHEDVSLRRHNHEKRLKQVLAPALEELTPAAHCVLRFAALLPPDQIATGWLKALVLEHHPELGHHGPDGEDYWFELIRLLGRQSLLSGVLGEAQLPNTVRMHRLIGEFLRAGMGVTEEIELRRYVARRAAEVYQQQQAPADWELDSFVKVIPHLLQTSGDYRLAVDGMFLSDKVLEYRGLVASKALLHSTGSVIRKLAEADETSAQMQRDLSISYDRLGDVSVAAGDLAGAKRYFEQGLAIRRKLAEADETNAQMQRDLAVSYAKLATVAEQEGDAGGAYTWWQQCLGVFESMEARGWHISPSDMRFAQMLKDKLR